MYTYVAIINDIGFVVETYLPHHCMYLCTLPNYYNSLLSLQYEDGGTVLSVASKKGHTQTVLLLLSHGAIVDHQDNVSVYTIISSEVKKYFEIKLIFEAINP